MVNYLSPDDPDHPLDFEIDRDSGIPIYIQLEEQIRLLVRGGRLKPGMAMPTVRALAVDLGINANTVTKIYRDLQRDGLLEMRRGVGTFVSHGAASSTVDHALLAQIVATADHLAELARRAGLSLGELEQVVDSQWRKHDAHA